MDLTTTVIFDFTYQTDRIVWPDNFDFAQSVNTFAQATRCNGREVGYREVVNVSFPMWGTRPCSSSAHLNILEKKVP
jgi:hypothetical protein